MKIKHIFTLILPVFLITACSDNKYEEYEGPWQGSFEGDREATLVILVDDEGGIRAGARLSDSENQSFQMSGVISEDGDITISTSFSQREIKFEGFANESSMSGSWFVSPDSLQGTWSAIKNEKGRPFPYFLIFNPNRPRPF